LTDSDEENLNNRPRPELQAFTAASCDYMAPLSGRKNPAGNTERVQVRLIKESGCG
jgi:hypothetical protein